MGRVRVDGGRSLPGIIVGAAALLLVAGCRERAPSAEYDGPFASEVREAIPRIERASGLRFRTAPRVEARSTAEVRAFLERNFDEERAVEELDGQVAAYKRLGLLADTLDVRQLLLDLLTEQIVGFYDPRTTVLYVVEDARPELRQTIIQHELLHALQDQYVDLDSLQRIRGNNDLSSALQAVIEGQATYEQMQAMLGPGDLAARLPGGWDRVRAAIRDQSQSMPLFSASPLVIQETLIFPYLSGAEFVRRLKEQDTLPVLRQRLPTSTEQVLHPRAYAEEDHPIRITLPAPAGGRVRYQNNLGEFETRLLLYQWLRDQNAAVRGAAGWGGDQYVLFDSPQGESIAWLTVWDAAVEAGEFFDVLDQGLRRRFRDLRVENVSAQERRYVGGNRAMRATAAEVQGRPAVLFVDVPFGGRTDAIIDLAGVRLSVEQESPLVARPDTVPATPAARPTGATAPATP